MNPGTDIHDLVGKKSPEGVNEEDDQEEQRLAAEQLTHEDIAFVINTMRREAPYDETSIKQLFCGMSSAFTKTPIPHNVNSKDAGAGKSYLLNLVAGYFSNQYILPLTGMSDKAIFHRPGVLVIEKNNEKTGEVEVEPVDPIINDLKLEIEEIEEQIAGREKGTNGPSISGTTSDRNLVKENKRRIKELESEINDIQNRVEKLIDLDNQIILCLDTPQDSLFDTLMSLMSQDIPRDQKYSFVEKSTSGKLGTKVNRLRGMPVLFTTRVTDDTRTLRFQEKNRRFINVTPETSNKKISAANDLIGLRYGSPPEEYDTLVVSREDKEKCKYKIKILVEKLMQHSKHFQSKESGIKIPFVKAITQSIPVNNQVWSMTVTDRIMKYLTIITKINMDSRPRIVNEQTGQFWPITIFEDLKESLRLMERIASGIRPYVAEWFNDVFLSAFKDLQGVPNKDKDSDGRVIITERHVGVTTEQLAEKTKEIFGGPKPNSAELLKKYLYPLINQGIIDKVQSELDRRHNIYFPVEEGNIFSLFEDPSDPRLKISSPEVYPSKHIVEESFRILSNYYSREGVGYKFLDVEGSEITIDRLVNKYFSSPESCFVKDWYPSEEQAIITRNILYCTQIIQQKQLLPPAWNNDFTESCKIVPVVNSRNIGTTERQPSEPILGPIINQSDCTVSGNSSRDSTAFWDLQENPVKYQIQTEAANNQAHNSSSVNKDSCLFGCFYCNDSYNTDLERLKHRELTHPNKLNYPSAEDFENRLRPNRSDSHGRLI